MSYVCSQTILQGVFYYYFNSKFVFLSAANFYLLKIIKMNLKKAFQKTEKSFNKSNTNMQPPIDISSDSSESDDEESAFETSENYQFQTINEIHQLKSTINQLEIDREHMLMSYQTALDKEHRFRLNVVNDNKVLQQQNERLREALDHIANENRTLIQEFENVKQHLDSLMSQNRRSSFQKDDVMCNTQMSKELVKKQRILQQSLAQAKDKLTQIMTIRETDQAEINKLKQENIQLNEKLQAQRKKEIEIKRNYEVMLQSKEDILRKMTTHNDQHLKNQISMKNKIINENKRQIEQYTQMIEEKDNEIKQLTEENNQLKQENAKNQKYCFDKFNEALKAQLKQKEDLIKITNAQIQNYQKKVNDFNIKIKQLQYQLTSIKQQNESISLEKQTLQQNINQLTDTIEQLQQESKTKESQITSIKKQHQKQIISSHKKIQQYETALSDFKQNIQKQQEQMQQQIKYYKEESEYYKNQMQTIITERLRNIQERNNLLIEQNEKFKNQNTTLKMKIVKMTEKEKTSEKLLRSQENSRRQYSEKITTLETQLFRMSLKNQQKQVDYKNEQQLRQLKREYETLKITNSTLISDKKQLLYEIEQLKKTVDESKTFVKKSEFSIKNYQRQLQQKERQLRTTKNLLEVAIQKAKSDDKTSKKKIQDLTQLIAIDNKRFEKKKQQFDQEEDQLRSQIRKYKNTIVDLQEEIERMKRKKNQNNLQLQRQVQQLNHQLHMRTKQLQTRQRITQANFKNKTRIFDDERDKLNEYVSKLQSDICYLQQQLQNLHKKNCALTDQYNIVQSGKTQRENLQHKNYQLKMQLSQALKQINAVLQKYQVLQQKYQEAISSQEFLENKFYSLEQKYKEACNDKNMLISELDTSYAKIQKLNANLLTKNSEYTFVKEQQALPPKSFARSQRQIQSELQIRTGHSSSFIKPVVSPQQMHVTSKTIKIPRHLTTSNTTVSSTNLNRYF